MTTSECVDRFGAVMQSPFGDFPHISPRFFADSGEPGAAYSICDGSARKLPAGDADRLRRLLGGSGGTFEKHIVLKYEIEDPAQKGGIAKLSCQFGTFQSGRLQEPRGTF